MIEETRKIELHHYLRVIRQRGWLLAVGVLSMMGVFFLWTKTQTPIYQASCKVRLSDIYDRASFLGRPQPIFYPILGWSESEAEIIKSGLLAKRVLSALLKKGISEEELNFLSKDPSARVARLKGGVSVRAIGKTNIIEIIYRGPSPELTREIAETLGEEYVKLKEATKKKKARELCKFIARQLKVVENILKEAEEALRNFKREKKIIALDKTMAGIITTLENYETEELKLSLEAEEIKFALAQLPLRMEARNVPYLNSALMKELNQKLVGLEIEFLTLSQQYQPSHPKLRRLSNQIKLIEEKLSSLLTLSKVKGKQLSEYKRRLLEENVRLRTRLEAIALKRKALAKIKAKLTSQLSSLLDNELEYVRLERRKKINERIYTMLLEREQEAKISESMERGGAVIIDYPCLPQKPIAPRVKTNLIFGAIIGIILGGFLMVGYEYLDTSIKSIEEVDRAFGSPILGFIPYTGPKKYRTREEAINRRLVTEGKALFKEAYKTLQTNIRFILPNREKKRILITSVMPREGKTLTVLNLGITSANSGIPTILVESDLRRPIIHHTLGIARKPGITDFLIDPTLSLETIIKPTKINNLFLVPSGTRAPNPPELLSSARMKEMVEKLSQKFPTVIFDTPPAIPVIDAVILASLVDCVLVVVEIGKTPSGQIIHLKDAFKKGNITISGVVINNIHLEEYYSPYGRRSSYYQYYYGEK
jgi:tyrosine-protein kinase Etk/Wzc